MPIIQTTKELRKRDPKDHYPTPWELCEAVVDAVPDLEEEYPYIIDPGSGEGVWGKAARKRWGNAAYVVGVEMDESKYACPEGYDAWRNLNYLDFPPRYMSYPEVILKANLIIGNPPYGVSADGTKDRKLAEKFVRHSWELLAEGGYIVFLLRTGFLEGQYRAKHFWPKYPLKQLWVLSRRPSFTGNRRTDATAYSIFVWQKGYVGETSLKWLTWDYKDEVR